jgi:hypothetical protein
MVLNQPHQIVFTSKIEVTHLIDELLMFFSLFCDLHSLFGEDLLGLNRLFRQNLFGLSHSLKNQAFPKSEKPKTNTTHNPKRIKNDELRR